MWYNQDQDKRLVSRLRLGQDERGLARLGLVSFETVLAWLIEKPVKLEQGRFGQR
jgi:hypothetical protein